eukprot:CAMPEP_0115870600 /NCGR_PEP_ID=MMETSP0287-20121206/22411_1 /TAXON_ID=412157 /ORGANISM="Chrysochromulina rotalis, Strain UIO044" /LENGTH=51 /DNA_ID=CAMNT_0003325329 /DNA_START=191 /DNA_END=346 /DNA_ORIENTATION=+
MCAEPAAHCLAARRHRILSKSQYDPSSDHPRKPSRAPPERRRQLPPPAASA